MILVVCQIHANILCLCLWIRNLAVTVGVKEEVGLSEVILFNFPSAEQDNYYKCAQQPAAKSD